MKLLKPHRPRRRRRGVELSVVLALVGVLLLSVPAVAGALVGSALRPSAAEVHLGAPRDLRLRVQRVCGAGPCQLLRLVRADGSADVTGGSESFYLTPGELHLYYQLPTDSVVSPPPTIAIIEAYADPTAEADLATFSQMYGLPACASNSTPQCFYEYDGSGVPFSPGVNPPSYDQSDMADVAGALETALDLEAAHATCENCRLMLVATNTAGSTDTGLADVAATVAWAAHNGGPGDAGAAVISLSYGWVEGRYAPMPGTPGYDDFVQPGHVIVASGGDGGYVSALEPYPASNPNVVSVGGTTLTANPDGTYGSEAVWNDSQGASGSACSNYPAPSWETSDLAFAAEGCTTRTVNDVSVDGDPATGLLIYQTADTSGSTEQVSGGTSLAVPIIAGVYALAGGYPAARTPPLGCPSGNSCAAVALYDGQAATPSALHDVTTGNNMAAGGDTCTATLCQAAAGLDGPTGVGTPEGLGAFGGPTRPDAVTGSATAPTDSSMTLTATVNPEGQSGTTAYFCWGPAGPAAGLPNCTNPQSVSGGHQSFSQSLSGLSAAMSYQYRAFASGPGGLGIGVMQTATTSLSPPVTPVLSALRISPRTFALAGRWVKDSCENATRENRKHRRCTRPIKLQISYQLNASAQIILAIAHALPGRQVNGRCVKPTNANHKHISCNLLIAVHGALITDGTRGAHSFVFNGRIGGHTLTPGDYRLTATPVANRTIGAAQTFTITS